MTVKNISFLEERACERQRQMAESSGGFGAYVPQCKPDGSFEEKQCHTSTGECWCVEETDGKEIEGSRKGSQQEVDCKKPRLLCKYSSHLKCSNSYPKYFEHVKMKAYIVNIVNSTIMPY